MLGRGEESTGGRDKASILADTMEAVIGTVYLSAGMAGGGDVRAPPARPADAQLAPRLGAGLDWKTSLQELTASASLGVPEYRVTEEGPDHEKVFTARVGRRRRGPRRGRRPQQEGGRAEGRRDRLDRAEPARRGRPGATAPRPRAPRPPTPRMPELPEVEVVRRGLQDHVVGRRLGRGAVPRQPRRPPAPARARRPRRPPHRQRGAGGRAPRQVPLARPAGPRRPPPGADHPPGHERPAARRGGGRAGREAPARHVRLRRRRTRSCGSSTSAPSAAWPWPTSSPTSPRPRPHGRPWGVPSTITHIAPDPLEPGYDQAAVVARLKAAPYRRQAGPARPDAGLGRRQHLRRRGPVAGAGCTASARPPR